MKVISLQTNQLKSRRPAEIDGHMYIVRRLGNIEQIEYAEAQTRLLELSQVEAKRKLEEPELAEVKVLSDKIKSMLISLFDDGGDQSKSSVLVKSFSDEDIAKIIEMVFSDGSES